MIYSIAHDINDGQPIKNFDNTTVDYLFVLTDTGDEYLIPSENIDVKTSLTIDDRVEKFKL